MTRIFLTTALTALATPLFADTIVLTAPVTAATLYDEGATLTREVAFSTEAGSHSLLVTGLPDSFDAESMRVSLSGATLGATTLRQDRVPPHDASDGAELIAARAKVLQIEADIRATTDARDDLLIRADAARDRLSALGRLIPQGDAEALAATLSMIETQSQAARAEKAAAEREARQFDAPLAELDKALETARQTVAALTPSLVPQTALEIAIETSAATSGTLTISHLSEEAGWMPAYDLYLDTGEAPALVMRRGALMAQYTGEDWTDVTVSLSTSRPDGQSAPTPISAPGYTLADKSDRDREMHEPVHFAPKLESVAAEPAVVIAEDFRASVSFDDGINATFDYSEPVTLLSNADVLRVALDELAITPRIFALANPLFDETAFLMAEMKNTTDNVILPSNEVSLYLNGQFIGQTTLGTIAKGDDADISFGPINGLRLEATLLERQSGDRGIITSSNEQADSWTMTARNLTGQNWDLRVLGRVPYSEQEDLKITYQANPSPSKTNLDDRRGILAWDTEIGVGQTFEVQLDHRISWPSDKVLR